MCCNSFISFLNVEILRVAIPDLCAEAVSASERFERGVYGWYQFLQPHFNGHQLPAGEAPRRVARYLRVVILRMPFSGRCFCTAN